VLRDAPPIRPTRRHDDPERHRRRRVARANPTLIDRHTNCVPLLAMGRAQQLVDVHDVGLELDDEQRPPTGMPRQDVDDAPLAIDRERHFRCRDPRRQVAERPCYGFMEARVTGVEQAVHVPGSPPTDHVDTDVELRGDRS